MGKYFGTDGIRGRANIELDPMLAFHTGQAAAHVLSSKNGHKTKILIGKDTRISSDMLEAALVAGICSMGVDVELLGVITTPAVAFMTVKHKADAGIVISASHNPFEHNGIKIFGSMGYKLNDDLEEQIEGLISNPEPLRMKTHHEIGRVIRNEGAAADEYVSFLAGTIDGDLSGLKIAVDCANGASCKTAAKLFSKVNADCEIKFDEPDGININSDCGSTHLNSLRQRVVSGGFDVGVAFDGDADRCLMVCENGEILDGDRIMAACALEMKREGRLKGDTFVATVMSNLGLHAFAKSAGMHVVCADVGDRFVLEEMLKGGFILGGEQSGHVIFLNHITTGDGQLTALQFLSLLKKSGKKASEFFNMIEQYPQVLTNVKVPNDMKKAIASEEKVAEVIREEENAFGEDGRILVRPSGTESLVRIMVEGKDEARVKNAAKKIADVINRVTEEKKKM
ncbi:MAG: phosphoglucosamine mutase [Bacillota bacterium]|nr:phosphoglucosamine mutase [Bacillota bacterium]